MYMRQLSRSVLLVCLLLVSLAHAQAEDQFFDSNAVKIRYIVEGKGEPVVLIHGFGANIEANWAPMIKTLSDSYEVIALDCRGHGKSDKPSDPKKYGREMAEDVVRLMDHLHIKKAHIVGYSMGSSIAYATLLLHSDRLLTLTLSAGGGIPAPDFQETVKSIGDAIEKDRNFDPLIRALWPPDMPAPTPQQLKLYNQLMRGRRTDAELDALAAVMHGGLNIDMTVAQIDSVLKTTTVPMLGIAGSADPLRKSQLNLNTHLKELRGDNVPLTLVTVDKGTHIDTQNRPEFLKAVRDFLMAHAATEKTASN